ncbi:MAG TPA: hypothetical protein VFR59_14285 [Steroidobacteraceae bacterium]|nr:hypothetical protein [Steroidobacteraceae bacterium]
MATKRMRRRGWSSRDEAQFRTLIKQSTPTRVIAVRLKRTPQAIRSKAHQLRVSLRSGARTRSRRMARR